MNNLYCKKIADHIIEHNINQFNSLLNGNAGICIFLYHLSKKTGVIEIEEHADGLLTKMAEEKFVLPSCTFDNGLAGVGWFVEYLVQNGFSEGNTNKILNEIDTSIFKLLNQEENIPLCLENGLLGYLVFMMSRLQNKDAVPTRTDLINKELFCCIIDKICECAPSQLSRLNLDVEFDLLRPYPLLLLCLSKALELNLYNEKIIPTYKDWLLYLETVLPGLHSHRVYMAYALSEMNKHIRIKSVENHINTLLYSVDCETLKSEINPYANNIRYGWMGIVWVLKQMTNNLSESNANYARINTIRCEIVEKFKPELIEKIESLATKKRSNTEMEQFGLSMGWAGIGLLLLQYPDAFTA